VRERERERENEGERKKERERARERERGRESERDRERERERERERWRARDACLVFCVEIFRMDRLCNIPKWSAKGKTLLKLDGREENRRAGTRGMARADAKEPWKA